MMKIMTWNVNLFNGNSCYEIWDKAKIRYSKRILEYIFNMINEKDDIAIVQEFPYRGEIVEFYKSKFEVLSWYDDEKFGKAIYRNNRIKSRTVALVTKESKWDLLRFEYAINFGKDGDKYNYVNKYVQLINESKGIELLGIHMHPRNTEKDKPEMGMEDLYNAIKNTNHIPNVIVGDFNAGNYQKIKESEDYSENKKNYIAMMDEYRYRDLVKDKTTTNYRLPTAIDHFWIKESVLRTYRGKSEVDYEEELSDHYPIVVELEYSEKR